MPSIIPDYEYDIFISYRHNDNRSSWVTDFVNALQEELAATIKAPLSIYFDSNPYDGLLETHNVDKSLEGKLKCLIFIPIISQTYCDTKSFAWQNEFCAFNRLMLQDELGRDIKLGNGNVASRILPVTIHNLGEEDIRTIETELQSKLRYIPFIYKSPGINRALRPEDQREDNIGRLSYRDQLNKLANALKEIMDAIKQPAKTGYTGIPVADTDSVYLQGELSLPMAPANEDKSIAVLPFVSLAQDSTQDYFADGIAENILILLASLKQLRVISRTSVMQYKKSAKTAPEIAKELGVKYILEGSAQSHANKVRINVQLIDALKDEPVWSRVFVESMEDIFTVQDKVAEVVAGQLQSSIGNPPAMASHPAPTKNLEAYDLFLKGRHAFNQWNVEGYKTASGYFKKAIEKDPEFKEAYSYMASSYSARMSWNGDLSPAEAKPLIDQYLEEAFKRGATDNDYLTRAFVEFFVAKNFQSSEDFLKKAMGLNPNNATVLFTYSYLLCMTGRLDDAQSIIEQARRIEPHSVAYFNYEGLCRYLTGRHEEAVTLFEEGRKLFPQVVRFYDHLGRVYLTMQRYQETKDVLTAGLRLTTLRPPSMVAYLAAAHNHLGEYDKAKGLLEELELRSRQNEKGVNYYLALAYSAVGDNKLAANWIAEAKQTNDIDLIWLGIDPLLLAAKKEFQHLPVGDCDFEGAETFILEKLKRELPDNLYYHNIDHTRDVLESAMRIAAYQKLEASQMTLLRIAALYHDSGFTSTYRDHELKGCELAMDTLPRYGFSEDQLNIICGMIRATKIPQSPHNEMEKILCDADLDYLGRDDFYEIGSKLFEEMKTQGTVETEREWNLVQKTFLESHRYHTDYGKNIREKNKQERLREIAVKLKNR